MPMTLEEMGGQLRELDLVFQEHAETNEIGLSFATRHYVDQDGENNLLLMLQLIENGEFLRIFCPKMFRLKKPKHAVPLMRLLGAISRRMKMAHFDFDEKSGEVVYAWEFPLEDGQATPAQLRRLIMAPVVLADTYGQSIRKVIKTGEIQLPKHPYALATPPKGIYPPGELADLMKLAGGVEGLRELLRERILRDKKRK
jgi:hypothetical protein